MKKVLILVAAMVFLCATACADAEINLDTGYTVTLPDGWVLAEPSEMAIEGEFGEEKAIHTLYDNADMADGYRIDVYTGVDDRLEGLNILSFNDRLDVIAFLDEYFSAETNEFWILGDVDADSGMGFMMSFAYPEGDNYLMAMTLDSSDYSALVFYRLMPDSDVSDDISDEDYKFFESVVKSAVETK